MKKMPIIVTASGLSLGVLIVVVFVFKAPRDTMLGTLNLFSHGGGESASADEAVDEMNMKPAPGPVTGTFTDETTGFSFSVPSGYHAQRIDEDAGEAVLVNPMKDGPSGSFEIYVTAFDGSAADITQANIENEAGVQVARAAPIRLSGQMAGLAFTDVSSDPPLWEAWFVHGGYLYQAEAWAGSESALQRALQSIHFSK